MLEEKLLSDSQQQLATPNGNSIVPHHQLNMINPSFVLNDLNNPILPTQTPTSNYHHFNPNTTQIESIYMNNSIMMTNNNSMSPHHHNSLQSSSLLNANLHSFNEISNSKSMPATPTHYISQKPLVNNANHLNNNLHVNFNLNPADVKFNTSISPTSNNKKFNNYLD